MSKIIQIQCLLGQVGFDFHFTKGQFSEILLENIVMFNLADNTSQSVNTIDRDACLASELKMSITQHSIHLSLQNMPKKMSEPKILITKE